MFNFEIKTKIDNQSEVIKRIKNIGAIYKEKMDQTDYYFQTGTSKEKIREINNQEISFISYKRSEQKNRKDSNYTITTLSPEQKESFLRNNRPLCVVSKVRQLWMYKNTRIHVDNVDELGDFMELETVIKNISNDQGLNEFNEVVDKLKIDLEKTEPYSYSDLILNKNVQKESEAIKKRENVHKMAEANKAFAHFAW
jgi:predicted adenylyl cyclase CyaB